MLSSLLVVLGLGLFLLPIWRLHAPDARLAAFDQREWPKGRNLLLALLDLARASGGAWLLAKGMPELPLLSSENEWMPDLVISAIVALGLTVQTFAWTDEDHVQAPVVFVAGVAAVLVAPAVAALVGVLAIGASLALRAWSGVFLAASVGTILIGWLLNVQSPSRVIFLGVALGLPVVLSILAGRHMGWPRK
jgi:hydrogenase-4 membrane subunit HyfE